MAPIGTSGRSIVPFRFRDSFFRDPYFSDTWDVIERQRRQFDRDCEEAREKVFGSTRSTSPFSSTSSILDRPTRSSDLVDYFKSTSGGINNTSSTLSNLDNDFKTEKDSYKVVLDVHQFKPEELCVKTSDDNNTIIIEGKHEEKKEDSSASGYIAREFTRKYTLPKDVKLEQLQCNLSADGVLQVTAPRVMSAITDGTTTASTNASLATSNGDKTEQKHVSNSFTSKQETSERMTVDGRKIDSPTFDKSKYDSYAKWKESRGEELDNLDSLTSTSKFGEDRAFSKHFDDIRNERRLVSKMRDWDNWDPFFRALPDFDMVPFWNRRSDQRVWDIERRDQFGLQSDAENFKVLVDAKQFAPEELNVRCTDQFVIIEGKHEEKEDPYGFISRHFTRKYDLPQGVRAEHVQCNLKENGILEIKAPRPKPKVEFTSVGRKVPIQMGHNSVNVNSHKTISEESNSNTKQESGSLFSTRSTAVADEEEQKRLREQQERSKRQESVESSASTTTGGRRVTIQELSRSSSANSTLTNAGEHVIPITIAAH